MCDLSDISEKYFKILLGICLVGRWFSSLIIALILLFKNYEIQILLLSLFALLCFLVIIFVGVFGLVALKYKNKSNDGYLYQSVFEEKEKKKKYNFYIKLMIIFIIISYIFSIGIIEKYVRFVNGYKNLNENAKIGLIIHITLFGCDILSASALACNYYSKNVNTY